MVLLSFLLSNITFMSLAVENFCFEKFGLEKSGVENSGVEISCNLFQLYARSPHHRHNHNCKLLFGHHIRNQAAEIM